MRPLRFAAALLVLGLCGCGPRAPLDLGVQEVPLSITLGHQGGKQAPRVITILLPGSNPFAPVTMPQLLEPGLGQAPAPAPSAAAEACPKAPPSEAPLLPASPDLLGEPRPGIYPYRLDGTWQPDSGKPQTFGFPAAGIRTVSQPTPVVTAPTTAASAYTYSVTDVPSGTDGQEKVETDFLVVPQNPTESAPGGQVVSQAAGIFIQAIITTGPGGSSQFHPSPPITYLNLPVAVGVSWTSSGTDPANGTTMKLDGVVEPSDQTHKTGRYRVDACGQVYDSWEVHAKGTLVGPSVNVMLDWYYDIATQFGGLELRDTLLETGSFTTPAGGPQGKSQSTQVINTITPKPTSP